MPKFLDVPSWYENYSYDPPGTLYYGDGIKEISTTRSGTIDIYSLRTGKYRIKITDGNEGQGYQINMQASPGSKISLQGTIQWQYADIWVEVLRYDYVNATSTIILHNCAVQDSLFQETGGEQGIGSVATAVASNCLGNKVRVEVGSSYILSVCNVNIPCFATSATLSGINLYNYPGECTIQVLFPASNGDTYPLYFDGIHNTYVRPSLSLSREWRITIHKRKNIERLNVSQDYYIYEFEDAATTRTFTTSMVSGAVEITPSIGKKVTIYGYGNGSLYQITNGVQIGAVNNQYYYTGSIYAPTSSGTSVSDTPSGRQILMSKGYGTAPDWETPNRYFKCLQMATPTSTSPSFYVKIYFWTYNISPSLSNATIDAVINFLKNQGSTYFLASGKVRPNSSTVYDISGVTIQGNILMLNGLNDALSTVSVSVNNVNSFSYNFYSAGTIIPNS